METNKIDYENLYVELSKRFCQLSQQLQKLYNNSFNGKIKDIEPKICFLYFPESNKGDKIDGYLNDNPGNWYKTRITKSINMTTDEYDYFTNNLLTDFDFLKCMGGYELNEEGEFNYYNDCILVYCDGEPKFVIDPEGYSYARYLAFFYDTYEDYLSKQASKASGDEASK